MRGRRIAVDGGVAGRRLSVLNSTPVASRPEQDPATRASWLLRRGDVGDAFGGGECSSGQVPH
jgi:hypothetical protein